MQIKLPKLRWIVSAVGIIFLFAVLMLGAFFDRVRITDYPIPERVTTTPDFAPARSILSTQIGIPIERVRLGLESDISRDLWSIDRHLRECVPRQDIGILGVQIARTPRVSCDVVGDVRRGSFLLEGRGNRLTARFPINATVRVENIGGVIARETATATAWIEVTARLGIDPQWRPSPDIDIEYSWVDEPGVDFLGQRIRFTNEADNELAEVIRQIEASLEREISSLDIRSEVESLWAQGFAIENLSRENPPVWLRLTPKSAGVGSLQANSRQVSVNVQIEALTEIFVGDSPERPEAGPLPANIPTSGPAGVTATLPVLADYSEVEPVVLRALRRLSDRGIAVDDLGRLDVAFEGVTIYATTENRIALGITATVEPVGNFTGRFWGVSSGEIWLTAEPVTEAGSEVVSVRNLQVFGDMDSDIGDLLVRFVQSEEVRAEIEAALVEDFRADYEMVIEKARNGIRSVMVGNVELRLDLATIHHGPIQVTSLGLFMPVEATGAARVILPVD